MGQIRPNPPPSLPFASRRLCAELVARRGTAALRQHLALLIVETSDSQQFRNGESCVGTALAMMILPRTRKMQDSGPTQTEIVFIEPLAVRIPTAVELTGLSRSRIYELIVSGDLEIIKVGRSTLVLYKSLKKLIGS